MKTARRHELQTNTLADWLGESIESAKPYARLIGGIALAGVVLVIFYFVMQSRSRVDDERGWQRYYQAISTETPAELELVAKDFPNTTVGYCAHLLAADRHLTEGCNELFTDRSKAKDSLQAAVRGYQAAMPAKDPLIQQRAMFGLAKAYEAQPDLEEARTAYKRLIDRFPKGVFAGVAQKRLDDLDRPATKDFYDWFAEATPLARPTGLDGFTPNGEKSPFLTPGNDSGMPNDDIHKSAFPFSTPGAKEGTADGEVPAGDGDEQRFDLIDRFKGLDGEGGTKEGEPKEGEPSKDAPATPEGEPSTDPAAPPADEDKPADPPAQP